MACAHPGVYRAICVSNILLPHYNRADSRTVHDNMFGRSFLHRSNRQMNTELIKQAKDLGFKPTFISEKEIEIIIGKEKIALTSVEQREQLRYYLLLNEIIFWHLNRADYIIPACEATVAKLLHTRQLRQLINEL